MSELTDAIDNKDVKEISRILHEEGNHIREITLGAAAELKNQLAVIMVSDELALKALEGINSKANEYFNYINTIKVIEHLKRVLTAAERLNELIDEYKKS